MVKKTLVRWKWPLLAGVAVVIFGAAFLYWHHALIYPSTDDAYVNANVVQVAPRVDGSVASVYVQDQQEVTRGQPLLALDPKPYELAVAQARAQLALARQDVGASQAAVAAADAEVRNAQVALDNADRSERRLAGLRKEGFVSAQASDNARAAADAARAQLSVAKAKREQALRNLGHAGARNERVRAAQSALAQAELNLSYTHVDAACDGHIANLTARPGNAVRAGGPLFALVCDRNFWIDANFKETQLARIRAGQSADITLDMYKDHHFKGRVIAVSGASGSAFSLLPPQNATGNWVKVTQRVPVRIAVVDTDPAYPLRVGTSAVVTVDTASGSARVAER